MNPELAALKETRFQFPGQTGFYRGKVRDVYTIGEQLVMVATDRISAFDVVLPQAIPGKGQVLNQLAAYFLRATADIVPNWVQSVPDPVVTIGRKCEPFKVEMVIRGYLAGHAAREYAAGKRTLCGVSLPEGLRENGPLPEPIITPTTKAEAGHDQDISREAIIGQELATAAQYETLEKYTRALFQRGTEMAAARGLILVDTKYEFGLWNGEIYLIDEIHTPDSSRYFYQEGYEAALENNLPPRQLSKEFVRQWLIKEGFQGLPGQRIPTLTTAWAQEISQRYKELYRQVTGLSFSADPDPDPAQRIYRNVTNALQTSA